MALTQVSTDGIKNGTIKDEDIKSDAAIDGTKIDPDFGSQVITTTGNASAANITSSTNIEIANSTASSDLVLLTLNASAGAGNSSSALRFETNSGSSSLSELKHNTNGNLALRTYGGGQLNDALLAGDAVKLYYGGATDAKIETTASGVTITGNDTGTFIKGDVSFYDSANSAYNMAWDQSIPQLKFYNNVKLTLGNSNELQVYHDGSTSYIKNTSDAAGNLMMSANGTGCHV